MSYVDYDNDILKMLEQKMLVHIEALGTNHFLLLTSLRELYLASTGHHLVRNGSICTKRDIYYCLRSLFPSVAVVESTLSSLSRGSRFQQNDFAIVSAPKGLVSGPIKYSGEQNETVVVNHFGPSGTLLPVRPERLHALTTSAKCILAYVVSTPLSYFFADQAL